MKGFSFMNYVPSHIEDTAVFIIGAGHFGSRAARILSEAHVAPLVVVDRDASRLAALEDLPVRTVSEDGICFLVENFPVLRPSHTIVPAVPVHLAFEWVKGRLDGLFTLKKVAVPAEIEPRMPFTWPGSEGSLLVSYSDFVCPDDCPEPEYCTVTGERRDIPLYRLMRDLDLPGFSVHVIRSRQLAPGLGGYRVEDLSRLAGRLTGERSGKWLLGSSCRCHGILTAFDMQPAS